MADRTIKKPMGVLYDVLVRVECFIFLAYFIILNYEVDFEVSIVFERPFFTTKRALVDIQTTKLKISIES